jgi:hypothetical protein
VLEFTPRAPARERLRGMEVSVNGHHQRSLGGAALGQRLRLPLAATGLTRVTLVGHTVDGRFLSASRDYVRPAG